MNRFYANICNGMSKSSALNEAQKYLREYTPQPETFDNDEMFDPTFVDDFTPEEHPYDNPHFWAAFVLLDAI